MADSLQVLGLLFNLGSGVLLVLVGGYLWFAPPPTAPKRLLALSLVLFGVRMAAGLLEPANRSPAEVTANDRVYGHLTFPAHLALLGFMALYPSRPPLRSIHGILLVVAFGIMALPALAWYLDPYALYTLTATPSGPVLYTNLLGRMGLREGLPVALSLGLISSLLRLRPLGPRARRDAVVLLAFAGPVGILAGHAVSVAQWSLGQGGQVEVYLRLLPQVQGDCCGLSWALLAGSALLPAWAVGYASLRLGSHALAGIVGLFLALSLVFLWVPGGFAYLQFPMLALGVLYAVRRRGALEVPALPPLAAGAVMVTVFALVSFGAALLVLALAGESAVAVAAAVLVGLMAGAGGAFLTHPGQAWLFGAPADPETTMARLGPYRAALEAEVATGAAPADVAAKLRGLRAELGVSEHEHAVLDYGLRGSGAARGRAARLEPGELFLGRYRVARALGRGGAGAAYLCRDERVGRDVVLKAYAGPAGSPEGLQGVLREARAIAAVRHPSVVTLYDVEQVGDEALIVMEHVAGGSLADRLRSGPLPPAEFARLAADLLSALEAVHAAGAVHRDVKPSNVLLEPGGRAKLADFGVAHLRGFETTAAGLRDGLGAVGTVRYMSPEQARGHATGPASDLYSAAATLYEAWTGQPLLRPRGGESAVELQMRAARGADLPARWAGPASLGRWFRRALDPDPGARFASAAGMRAALEQALAAADAAGTGGAGAAPR